MIRLFIMAAILIILNVLAYNFNFNIDLTLEKRFTLSPNTKKMLRNMKDVAVVDVYLKGDFPAGFKKLQEATRERLRSFKEYAGNHIIFHFIDPLEGKSEQEKQKVYEDLMQKGIVGVDLRQNTDQSYSERSEEGSGLRKIERQMFSGNATSVFQGEVVVCPGMTSCEIAV